MKKIYILDTCTLIHDPNVVYTLQDCSILIPIAVVDELDKLKSKGEEVGRNARVACKILDKISATGDVVSGVLLESGSLLRIDPYSYHEDIQVGDSLYGDNRILAAAIYYDRMCKSSAVTDKQDEHVGKQDYEAIFLTRDVNAKVRARVFGVKSEHYEKESVSKKGPFSGVSYIQDDELLEQIFSEDYLDEDLVPDLKPNEFLIVEDTDKTSVAITRHKNNEIVNVKKQYPWDLSPRNPEQVCAIDLLMDPNVALVTLVGAGGSGKTLITLAACLEMVIGRGLYDKVSIYRPIQAVGADIGYLPGDQNEKLAPWMEPIYDAAEVLFKDNKPGKASKFKKATKDWRQDFQMYVDKGQIELNAMTYVRGRSLPNSIILIDEVQNISKHDIKTLLTRAGDNTKVILTGDIEQIDNNKLDISNNGLTYVLEKFKDYDIAGHITLVKGERSKLATLAAEIL
jgi:PhoH-like ATPase